MKKFYILVILLSMGITQIYAQCYQCTGTAFKIGNTTATGDNSFAGGNLSATSADNSFVFGNASLINGLRGIALGSENKVFQTDGITIGNNLTAAAANSYLFGQNLYSSAANSITIGLGSSSSSLLSNTKANSIMFGVTNKPSLTIVQPSGGGDVGYLGIGTDTPEKMVHVVGNLLIDRTTSMQSSLQFRHPDNTRDVGPGGGDYPVPYFWDIFSDYSGLKFNTVASNGISTQSMFIGRSGFVGIGVPIPQAKLHVGQNILADGNIITRDKLVLAPDNTGRESWEISRTSTGLNYTFTDRQATDVLFMGSDGNIGIGKTNPASKLDVNGILTTNALTAQSANIAGKLGIGVTGTLHTNLQIGNVWTFQDAPNGKNIGRNTRSNSNADWRIEAGAASRIAFNSAGDILLQTAPTGAVGSTISNWSTVTLANNGKVGIGIAIPSAMLEVSGDIKGQSAEITGTASANELLANSATINGLIKANNAEIDGNLSADALNANSATINGDATISGKLTANDMRIENLLCAKEVKVQLANCWPDYVFSKNYNLMPLQELEQFVNKNQHLPNVPSATDVEANGIDLGEMNATLLKKVEELTLYIIQIEKRLSELESVKGGK